MSAVTLEKTRQTVSFKNEQISCTFLKIDSYDIKRVENEICNLTQRAPNLLNNLPIILDCNFDITNRSNINNLYESLLDLPINVVGIVDNEVVSGTSPPWPLLSNIRPRNICQINNLKTLVVDRKVRSGDTIEAFNEHLIILGNVSSGAEVYSTGNIYIFGQLNGKAFAGMNGANNASITCQELNAELIAIAGIYSVHDDTNFGNRKNVKIFLDGNALNYRYIN